LLWADQNLRDFGDRHRLLTSQERNSCFAILGNLSDEELERLQGETPYFTLLDLHQANLDNVTL